MKHVKIGRASILGCAIDRITGLGALVMGILELGMLLARRYTASPLSTLWAVAMQAIKS